MVCAVCLSIFLRYVESYHDFVVFEADNKNTTKEIGIDRNVELVRIENIWCVVTRCEIYFK